MTFADLVYRFFAYLYNNKQAILSGLVAVLAFVQASPDLKDLLDPVVYKWFMFTVTVVMLLFARSTSGGFVSKVLPPSVPADKGPPPSPPATPESGHATVGFMLGIALVGVLATMMLTGCPGTVNPMGAAQTVEQKAYAGYGTVTIFAERGAALIADPNVSQSIKTPVAQAIVATKAPADKLMEALLTVEALREEVAAGGSDDEKLLIAGQNLNRYYLELEPLIGDLTAAVLKGVRCRSKVGPELTACLGGA